MPPLSPLRVVSVANAFLGLGEEPGPHPGRLVETMLRGCGQPVGGRWDVAFASHVGYWALYEQAGEYSPWPLPRTASAEDLRAFAEEREILRDTPEVGDIALVAGAKRGSIARVGIVIDVQGSRIVQGKHEHTCILMEGNASPEGRPSGQTVVRVRRDLQTERGDRVVRWADLEPRNAIARADRYAGVSMRRPILFKAK